MGLNIWCEWFLLAHSCRCYPCRRHCLQVSFALNKSSATARCSDNYIFLMVQSKIEEIESLIFQGILCIKTQKPNLEVIHFIHQTEISVYGINTLSLTNDHGVATACKISGRVFFFLIIQTLNQTFLFSKPFKILYTLAPPLQEYIHENKKCTCSQNTHIYFC